MNISIIPVENYITAVLIKNLAFTKRKSEKYTDIRRTNKKADYEFHLKGGPISWHGNYTRKWRCIEI